ncbi:MAG: serine hydrolase domain-containing protein [Pseudomonadota bacterium]
MIVWLTRAWVSLIVGTVFFASSAQAHSDPETSSNQHTEARTPFPTKDATQYLEALSQEHEIPGLAVAVIRDGQLAYLGLAGTQDGEIPVTDETQFHSASISKLFTATAIMQLVDAGKLDLDQPLGAIFPKFEDKRITIRRLLTHRAGFANRVRARGEIDRVSTDEYLGKVQRKGLSYPPGTKWRYNDADYNILGAVVTKVSGMPFDRYTRRFIFEPLGMKKSSFFLPDVLPSYRAAPHRGSSAKLTSRHPYDFNFAPSSGLQITATDLALFLVAHLQKDTALLNEASYNLMQQAVAETEIQGIEQGLGWQVLESPDRPKILQHGGSDRGFRALVSIQPANGTGIVILSNGENTPRWEIAAQLQRFLDQ